MDDNDIVIYVMEGEDGSGAVPEGGGAVPEGDGAVPDGGGPNDAAGASSEPTNEPPKAKRARTSPVWEHFENTDNPRMVQCKHCEKVVGEFEHFDLDNSVSLLHVVGTAILFLSSFLLV